MPNGHKGTMVRLFLVWKLLSQSSRKYVDLYTHFFLLNVEQRCAFPEPASVSNAHTFLTRYFQDEYYSEV